MSKAVPTFWMVWNPAARNPNYKHVSRQGAQVEAKRLAALHPGHEFYVLKVEGGYCMPSPEPETITIDDGVPF